MNSPVINGGKSHSGKELPVSDGDCRELVQRIADSSVFHKSARLRELLLYIADRTLSDRREDLTEAQIGIHVFGRAESYNPGEDSIVRVSARHLRLKLGEYFQQEGAAEPLGIEIPKGSYTAVFAPRLALAPQAAEHAVTTPPVPVPGEVPAPTPQRLYLLLSVSLVVSLAAAAGFAWAWWSARSPAAPRETLARLVLTAQPGGQTLLVVADTGLIVAEKITETSLRIQDYASGGIRQTLAQQFAQKGGPPDLARHLGVTQHTGIADAAVYGRILRSNPDLMDSVVLRHARSMSPREFQNGNMILIGGPRSNPWTTLFAEHMHFESGYDPATQAGFLANRKPVAGEPSRFADQASEGIGYGHVLLLPSLGGSGRVLIIGGTTMSAKEAAGEFVTDAKAYQQLLASLHLTGIDRAAVVEVVIQATGLGGSSRGWRVVAQSVSDSSVASGYKQ